MYKKDTGNLLNTLNKIYKKEDLNKFVSNDLSEIKKLNIGEFFCYICEKKHITKSELIKKADIDRTYGYQIFDGRKNPSRDKILRLCLAAKLDLKETKRALEIGKVAQLYPKEVRDSIIIFAINNKISIIETNELLSDKKEKLL